MICKRTFPLKCCKCILGVLLVVLFSLGIAAAEITEVRQVGDKTIYCERTGLSSSVADCGTESDWYTYVFVGSISAITSIGHDEKKLQIIPEEIFKGNPANSLEVKTSQALCLHSPWVIAGFSICRKRKASPSFSIITARIAFPLPMLKSRSRRFAV